MNKNDSDNPNEMSGKDYENIRTQISRIILDMYLPAEENEVDEFVSCIDLLETIRGLLEVEAEYLLAIMIELGFKMKNIEGGLYWMVKEST